MTRKIQGKNGHFSNFLSRRKIIHTTTNLSVIRVFGSACNLNQARAWLMRGLHKFTIILTRNDISRAEKIQGKQNHSAC